MNNKKIYNKACEILLNQEPKRRTGCCYCLNQSLQFHKRKSYQAKWDFENIFKPRAPKSEWYFGARNYQNTIARSLALILMAEFSKKEIKSLLNRERV